MAKKTTRRKVADHGPTEAETIPAAEAISPHAGGVAETTVDSKEADHGETAGDTEEVQSVKAEIEGLKPSDE